MKFILILTSLLFTLVVFGQNKKTKNTKDIKTVLTSLSNIKKINFNTEFHNQEHNKLILKKNIKIINSPDYNGFSVNENGELISYAKKYDYKEGVPSIKVIQIGSKYYAIASIDKGNTFGIIDQEGKEYNNFGFKFKELELNTFHNSNKVKWFYFKDTLGNNGFISNKNRVKEFNVFNEFHNNSLGLPIVKNTRHRKVGVYNLHEMKWYLGMKEKSEYSKEIAEIKNYTQDIQDTKSIQM